jgi:hypothetical protein
MSLWPHALVGRLATLAWTFRLADCIFIRAAHVAIILSLLFDNRPLGSRICQEYHSIKQPANSGLPYLVPTRVVLGPQQGTPLGQHSIS